MRVDPRVDPITNLLRAGQIAGLHPRQMIGVALEELQRDKEQTMPTTKLERRIAEVADATGLAVVVGRQGHKDEWFAHCGGIEWGGSSALAALESVVGGLKEKADRDASEARAAEAKASRLRAL